MKHKFILLFVFCFLSACARHKENKEINPTLFNSSSRLLITEINGLKSPTYYVHVEQNNSSLIAGLISGITQSIAMNANQDAAQRVEALQLFPLAEEHYHKPFSKAFREKGFDVQNMLAPLLREGLTKVENEDAQAPFDFRFLKDHHQVEYAFVMIPASITLIRYPGLFGKSVSETKLEFYLVRLLDNMVMGYYNSLINVPIDDAWDNPPEYPLLVSGIETSVKSAFAQALQFFFKEKQLNSECN